MTKLAEWAPKSKVDRYEPHLLLDLRIERVRRHYSSGLHYRRRLKIFDKACAKIDRAAYQALQEEYASVIRNFNPRGPAKYLDVVYWIWHKTALVEDLDLDCLPPQSVLDLGMGGGHFGFILEALGHSSAGLDLSSSMYEDICRCLGVTRKIHTIREREPLPPFGRKFDLVTALWIKFDCTGSGAARRYWGLEEWAWFFADLRLHLTPNARVYLELNQRVTDSGIVWDDDFVDACERAGARIDRTRGRSILWERPPELTRMPEQAAQKLPSTIYLSSCL